MPALGPPPTLPNITIVRQTWYPVLVAAIKLTAKRQATLPRRLCEELEVGPGTELSSSVGWRAASRSGSCDRARSTGRGLGRHRARPRGPRHARHKGLDHTRAKAGGCVSLGLDTSVLLRLLTGEPAREASRRGLASNGRTRPASAWSSPTSCWRRPTSPCTTTTASPRRKPAPTCAGWRARAS